MHVNCLACSLPGLSVASADCLSGAKGVSMTKDVDKAEVHGTGVLQRFHLYSLKDLSWL